MSAGRPTIDPDGDRHFLHVQVSRDLKDSVAAAAEDNGIAPAQYTRMVMTDHFNRVLPRISELKAEIARLNILLAEKH